MAERKFNCRQSASSYKNGCRCAVCRRAYAAYSREWARARRKPGWMPQRRVDPAEAKRHLAWLHEHGVGVVAVHRSCGVDMNTLIEVREGRRKYLMADTEKRILAVGLHKAPSVEMVREHVNLLIRRGWTQGEIAVAAGISRDTVSEIVHKKRKKVWLQTAERTLAISPTSGRPGR